MTFLQTFLITAIPCVAFGVLAYATEWEWKAKDSETVQDLRRRVMEADTRPVDLYDRGEIAFPAPPFPWKHELWWKV